MRKIFIILLCSVAVLLAGYAGYRGYEVWKCNHLMSMARQFLAKKDGRNALLCVQEVLRTDPHDLDATRTMAELTTAAGSPVALVWWSRVVELNPHSLTNRLALADTAIRMGNYGIATNALAAVDQADRNTVGYQNVAGEVALGARQLVQAEAHFLKASQIDPQNQSVQLSLAVVRLFGTNELDREEAQITLERISQNPTNALLRDQALRVLTEDALRHREFAKALSVSKELVQETNSAFMDRLTRLTALQLSKNAEFKPALAAYQREAATNPVDISLLASWQLAKTTPLETLAWLRTLSATMQTNLLVELPMANCYIATSDWLGLQSALETENWLALEFMRHALLTLSLRKQGLADSAKAEWEQALQSAAAGGPKSLAGLLELARRFRWQNEQEEILWMMVNRYPGNLVAVQALTQLLFSEGRTQSLMQLYSQEVKLFPSNAGMKNNLAMTALLLNAQDFKPYELAREVYQSSPTNASYVSTYAFSLYKQGKNTEALKAMKTLNPAELKSPSIAGYYGLILKATGNREGARAYLDWSAKAHLLPEEKKMFSQAKAGL
jgi:predicted Zn-dependent protease